MSCISMLCFHVYAHLCICAFVCICVRVYASTSHICTYICCVFVGMTGVYAHIVCSSVCRVFECMSCIRAYVLRLCV